MVATFNILGFDQLKIMSVQQEKQINLNGNDLIVLRNIVDMIEGRRLETKDIDNKSYTWIKYSLLVENLIFVSDKEDTFKKIVSKLVKCTLLERQVVKSVGNGAYTYFRKTELLESIMYKEGSSEAKKVKRKTYKKKEQAEKIEVLDGQVTVEEVLQQEKTDVEAGWKLKNKETNGINPRSFNNFEGRSYQYDKLEAMLLGHEDYSEEDIHEVLSNSRTGNYTSNNSKRLNGVEIGTNVAV